MLLAPDGKLYVMSVEHNGSLYAYDPAARSLDLMYDYSVEEGRSAFLEANLLLVDDHRIIGTTYSGGAEDEGALFEYDLNTETWRVPHSFGAVGGRSPSPTLALLGRRVFGSTTWGGNHGRGALFEYDLDAETFSVKAHFVGDSSQSAGIAVAPDGNLYLQASIGGADYHGGVIRYDPVAETLETVHSFATSGTNIPTGSLFTTWAGRLFGVTRYGGSGAGLGTIYEVNASTDSLTIRQNFDDGFPVDTRLIEVGERPVTSVVIQAPATSIDADDGTLALASILLPAEAANQPVVWSVDNPAVATINANGVLTATGNGTVVVTATANYGLGVDNKISITVTSQDGVAPAIPVETLALSPAQVFFTAYGDTQQLAATVAPTNASNKDVTWESSATSVATVSATGLLQAIGSGTATVTATATDGTGASASLQVRVTQLVTGLAITPLTSVIDQPGQTIDFDVVVTPANATKPAIVWSEDSISATIDANGVLTPLGNGTVTITAKTTDGSNVSATRTLTMSNQHQKVLSLNAYATTPSGKTSSITQNLGTLQMKLAYSPLEATDPTMTWVSSDPSVATVDATGLVTAARNGITTIKVTSIDGPSDTHVIRVYSQEAGPVTVTSIAIDPQTAIIDKHAGTVQATATILPADAIETEVTWTMIGDQASISSDGLVTALANGAVQFRAHTRNIYGSVVSSELATLTITNQIDPRARVEFYFEGENGKLRVNYTRSIGAPDDTLGLETSTNLREWTPFTSNTSYTVLSRADHGDGSETFVLELADETLTRHFLRISAED